LPLLAHRNLLWQAGSFIRTFGFYPEFHDPDWLAQMASHASRGAFNRRERFWIPDQICPVDGGTRPNFGSTPFRQFYPAYPSADNRNAWIYRAGCPRAKGSAGIFQRGKFPDSDATRKRISQKLNHGFSCTCQKLVAHNKLGL